MKMLSLTLAFLLLPGAALAFQQAAKATATPGSAGDEQVIAQQLPSYPLDVCPISKEKLGGDMGAPVDLVYEGRLVRFCCKNCVKDFRKDPAPVLKQIDAAVIKAQKASYPLSTCPVSGESLDVNGAPVDHVMGTRLVRFCCNDCVKEFQKDPAKVMAKVDAALIEKQKKDYPLTTCLISGKTIEGPGVDYLYGTRLVRFCCPKCPAAFLADPAKNLAKLDAAAKHPREAGSPAGDK